MMTATFRRRHIGDEPSRRRARHHQPAEMGVALTTGMAGTTAGMVPAAGMAPAA